ncbi:MAG: hypothetical protein K2X47_09195 [Bdellovibrionales bacterium]|nr:hypothetical protein [Bdellovibrionales bacterium]
MNVFFIKVLIGLLICQSIVPAYAAEINAKTLKSSALQIRANNFSDTQALEKLIFDIKTFHVRAPVERHFGDFVGANSVTYQDSIPLEAYETLIQAYRFVDPTRGQVGISEAIFDLVNSARFWAGFLSAIRLNNTENENRVIQEIVSIIGPENALKQLTTVDRANAILNPRVGDPETTPQQREQARLDNYVTSGDWQVASLLKVVFLGQRSPGAINAATQKITRYFSGGEQAIQLLKPLKLLDDSYIGELLESCHYNSTHNPLQGAFEELDRIRETLSDDVFRPKLMAILMASKTSWGTDLREPESQQYGALFYMGQRDLFREDEIRQLIGHRLMPKFLEAFKNHNHVGYYRFPKSYFLSLFVKAITGSTESIPENLKKLRQVFLTEMWRTESSAVRSHIYSFSREFFPWDRSLESQAMEKASRHESQAPQFAQISQTNLFSSALESGIEKLAAALKICSRVVLGK